MAPLERERPVRIVVMASVIDLDPLLPEPTITGRILRAGDSGTWEEVTSGQADLSETVEPGVYRAEIQMIPEHLRPSLGRFAEDYLVDTVWIYSNPIYVGME